MLRRMMGWKEDERMMSSEKRDRKTGPLKFR